MRVYADSSFLASLYLKDRNFQIANELLQITETALPLTSFGAFELKNAVRAGVIRGSIRETEARRVLALIQRDTDEGLLAQTSCDWEDVYREADRLSDRHTFTGGHRALDVLHVAAAMVLGFSDFWTLDRRQAELARNAGLQVHP